jgi:hypothetical protein
VRRSPTGKPVTRTRERDASGFSRLQSSISQGLGDERADAIEEGGPLLRGRRATEELDDRCTVEVPEG